MEQKSPFIVNADEASFDEIVLSGSHKRPIVLDFWASWCQPCQILGPLLEDLAQELDGGFTLVKADTETVLEPARRFAVQSIPAVFGITHGETVDSFVGVLPKSALRTFVVGLIRTHTLKVAQSSEATNEDAARQAYRELIEQAPDDAGPRLSLARLLLKNGEIDGALAHVTELEDRGVNSPELRCVRGEALLAGFRSIDLASARSAASSAPNDAAAKMELARALSGSGQTEAALDTALEVIPMDRAGVGEDARLLILAILDTLDPDDDLVRSTRRRLSMTLF